MEIKVETVEVVDGDTINPNWKKPMVVVNGQYYSSTIKWHNVDKKALDVVVGETYTVGVTKDNWIWVK